MLTMLLGICLDNSEDYDDQAWQILFVQEPYQNAFRRTTDGQAPHVIRTGPAHANCRLFCSIGYRNKIISWQIADVLA